MIDSMYEKARLSRLKIQKFERFLDGDTVPDAMKSARERILRTTEYDDEIEENTGGTTLLPELFECYDNCATDAHFKLEKFVTI